MTNVTTVKIIQFPHQQVVVYYNGQKYTESFEANIGEKWTASVISTTLSWTPGKIKANNVYADNGIIEEGLTIYATLATLDSSPELYGTIDFDDLWKRTILSQYSNSEAIKYILNGMSQLLDPNPDFKVFYDHIFNPTTCNGIGTRIWATIVAMDNQNGVDVKQGDFFGYNTNTSHTIGVTSSFYPFNQKPFVYDTPGSGRFVFTDASLRVLIMAKALANITTSSLPTLKTFLKEILGNDQFSVDNLHSTAGSGGYAYIQVSPETGDSPVANKWYEKVGINYVLSSDTVANREKIYYKEKFVEVTPSGSENPSSKGWYEKVNQGYVLTSDTKVKSGKRYYTITYVEVTPIYPDIPQEKGWYEQIEGEYIPTTDITIVEGKIYYQRVYAEMTVKFVISGTKPVTLQLFKLYAPKVVGAGVKIIYQSTGASFFGFEGSDLAQNFDNGCFYDEETAGWYFGEL